MGSAAHHIIGAFGDMQLADVRPHHVETWLSALADAGYSRETGKALLTRARSVFKVAVRNGYLDRNPAEWVRLPDMHEPEETQPFSPYEVTVLVGLPAPLGTILQVLLFCGLRPSEALAIRASDVHDCTLTVDESTDSPGRFKSTKTGEIRRIALPPLLGAALEAMASGLFPDELLFPTWATSQALLGAVRREVGERVPDFTLRRCRTTCATLLKADAADVQAVLGHARAKMTLDRYRRSIPERQREALAALEAAALEVVQ